MVDNGKGYAGRINNAGSQEVKAPQYTKAKGGTSKVLQGGDLRAKASKNKSGGGGKPEKAGK